MPRYFFHLEDGGRVTDPQGEELPDENAAREAAEQIASLILPGSGSADWRVTVTTEEGEKVVEIPAWKRTVH